MGSRWFHFMWVYPSKTCNKCWKSWERCSAEVVQKKTMVPEGNANVRLPCCLRFQPYLFFTPFTSLPSALPRKKKTKNILALLIRLAFESWKPCCRCEKSNISCFIDVPDWCSHNSALRWFLKCRRQPLQFSVKGGEKKLVLFCIFPIVPWENTIKYELVLFSVLFDYLTWSGALSLRPIGSHRRQGSFQTGVNRQFIRNYFQQWINSHFPSAGRMQADVEPTVLIIMKTNVTPTQS